MNFIPELEGALHLRALSNDHIFNPFFSAGIGAGRYSKVFVSYVQVSVGLQINLLSETYFFLQNYRFSMQSAKLDNNTISYGRKKWRSLLRNLEYWTRIMMAYLTLRTNVLLLLAWLSLTAVRIEDMDGIADKYDRCPDVAGTARYNGCPVPDTDNDGVNDEEDKCLYIAGMVRNNGCPISETVMETVLMMKLISVHL